MKRLFGAAVLLVLAMSMVLPASAAPGGPGGRKGLSKHDRELLAEVRASVNLKKV